MPKHKIINVCGVDIRVKDNNVGTRKKITTQINMDNYKFIRNIHNQSKIELSTLYDNLITLVKNNPDILKIYLKQVQDY